MLAFSGSLTAPTASEAGHIPSNRESKRVKIHSKKKGGQKSIFIERVSLYLSRLERTSAAVKAVIYSFMLAHILPPSITRRTIDAVPFAFPRCEVSYETWTLGTKPHRNTNKYGNPHVGEGVASRH